MMRVLIKLLFFFICALNAQNETADNKIKKFAHYQLSSEKYFTNSEGTIVMKVNIWGNVNNPGSHLVYEGIDFASLLSLVGGPISGANLKKVRLYREIQDSEGILVHKVDLSDFIRTGDRSNFVKINPKRRDEPTNT